MSERRVAAPRVRRQVRGEPPVTADHGQDGPAGRERLLDLQRAAGNRATVAVVQRDVGPDGTITDPEELERLRPAGSDVDVETRARTLETLLATPRSRTVLDAIERLRGDVHFPIKWAARGGYHRNGTIYLDRRGNEPEWLSTMAHEIVHLHTFLAGNAADVESMGREEFVDAKMTDEINAHAATYVTLLQLGTRTSPAAGYDRFRRFIRRRHRRRLRRRDWAAIETLARPWLEDRYRHDWRGSRSGENYYEKWGRIWDEAHADD